MDSGLIRTPLPATETFKDDPLRLLRAIRFASRYNYRLDDGIITAATDPLIVTALIHKVSKPRILKELDGMLGNSRVPYRACQLLYRLGILDCVFRVSAVDPDKVAVDESSLIVPTGGAGGAGGVDKHALGSVWQQRSMDIAGYCALICLLRQQEQLKLGFTIAPSTPCTSADFDNHYDPRRFTSAYISNHFEQAIMNKSLSMYAS
jgi:hypothetical protein